MKKYLKLAPVIGMVLYGIIKAVLDDQGIEIPFNESQLIDGIIWIGGIYGVWALKNEA